MNDNIIMNVVNNRTKEVTIYYNITFINVINNILYIVTSNGNTYQISIDNNSFAIYNN